MSEMVEGLSDKEAEIVTNVVEEALSPPLPLIEEIEKLELVPVFELLVECFKRAESLTGRKVAENWETALIARSAWDSVCIRMWPQPPVT